MEIKINNFSRAKKIKVKVLPAEWRCFIAL